MNKIEKIFYIYINLFIFFLIKTANNTIVINFILLEITNKNSIKANIIIITSKKSDKNNGLSFDKNYFNFNKNSFYFGDNDFLFNNIMHKDLLYNKYKLNYLIKKIYYNHSI